MAGFRLNPRRMAVVSFYGYGDIAGDWYSRPDPFYNGQPAVTKEAAYQAVGTRLIADDEAVPTRNTVRIASIELAGVLRYLSRVVRRRLAAPLASVHGPFMHLAAPGKPLAFVHFERPPGFLRSLDTKSWLVR